MGQKHATSLARGELYVLLPSACLAQMGSPCSVTSSCVEATRAPRQLGYNLNLTPSNALMSPVHFFTSEPSPAAASSSAPSDPIFVRVHKAGETGETEQAARCKALPATIGRLNRNGQPPNVAVLS